MPYTVDSKNLPANVTKLSAVKRRQWVHVFNSALEKHGSEETAFAMANAVAKSEKSVKVYTTHDDPDLPDHIKSMPANVRRRWTSSHNYHAMENGDPASARRYADENTYITLDEHKVMAGMIGGKKAMVPADDNDDDVEELNTDPKVVAKKKPVKKSIFDGLIDNVKNIVGIKSSVEGTDENPFLFFKDAEGRTRVFVVYSNVFKDAHKEIISEAAHKEYVEWVDTSAQYPELQLWHGGTKTRWGEIDVVDFVDGFAIASGPVDEDKEHIAEALRKEKNLKVSHGFYSLKDNTGTHLIYRPFEISALPAYAAANQYTAISLLSKEFILPLSENKKAFFKRLGVNDTDIAGIDTNLKDFGEKLKAAGVEFKDNTDAVDAGTTGTESAAASNDGIVPAALGVLVNQLSGITKAIGDLAGVVATSNKEVGDLKARVAATEAAGQKSLEDQLAALVLSKQAAGVAASAKSVAGDGSGASAVEAVTAIIAAAKANGQVVSEAQAKELEGIFGKKDAKAGVDVLDGMLAGHGMFSSPAGQ